MLKKYFLPFLFFYFLGISLFFRDIPFFADTTYYSELASHLYDSDFSSLVPPVHNDPGGPALFSWLLALTWMLFGKTLIVSHLFSWVIICGVIYECHRFFKKYLSPLYSAAALVLICADPTILTQVILMGYDTILALLFIFSLNRLLEQKRGLFIFGNILLVLYGARGIPMVASLFFVDVILHRNFLKASLAVIPSVLLFSGWMLYHHSVTGWYLFHPMREENAEALVEPEMFFRKIGFSIWKIIDLGRIFVFIPFIFLLKKKYRNEKSKKILLLVLIPLSFTMILVSSITNPVGHRYFIPFMVLFPLISFYLLQEKKIRPLVFTFITAVMLFIGNFWYYPDRFGNGWDSSLKIIPYFEIKKELFTYLDRNNIPLDSVGAKTPLLDKSTFAELEEPEKRLKYIRQDEPLSVVPYFVISNISLMYSEEEKAELNEKWQLVKSWKKRQVEVKLFRKKG